MEVKDQIALMRVKVRAALAVMLVMTLCCAVFLITEYQEFMLGNLNGAAMTALVFYYKKSEENGGT